MILGFIFYWISYEIVFYNFIFFLLMYFEIDIKPLEISDLLPIIRIWRQPLQVICMYTVDIVGVYGDLHLATGGWYLDFPIKNYPFNKISLKAPIHARLNAHLELHVGFQFCDAIEMQLRRMFEPKPRCLNMQPRY